MAEADPERGTITVIYKVVGKSTELFKNLREGDSYQDAVGPWASRPILRGSGTSPASVEGPALPSSTPSPEV